MKPEDNKQIIRRYLEGNWDYEKLQTFREVLAPDYLFHGPWGEIRGVEAFRAAIAKEQEALEGLYLKIDEMVAEGDTVAVRHTTWFTHQGTFLNAMGSGRSITMQGMSVHRIVGGKVAETWDSYDRLRLLRDLGSEERLSTHDEEVLRAEILDALQRGFTDYLTHYYADDAEMIPARGEAVRGRPMIRRWIDEFPKITEWGVTDLEVGGAGQLAYACGHYSMTIRASAKRTVHDTGHYMEVWRKQPDDAWKVVRSIFHSNLPVRTRVAAHV